MSCAAFNDPQNRQLSRLRITALQEAQLVLLVRSCRLCQGKGRVSELPPAPQTYHSDNPQPLPRAQIIDRPCPACHGQRIIYISTTVQ